MTREVDGSAVARDRAAFLGRFQPFHRGHHHVVKSYASRFDELVIVVGSCQVARTPRNPLSAAERRRIVAACHPDLDQVFLPDEGRGAAGYEAWAHRLERETKAAVIITRNDLVRRLVDSYTDMQLEAQPLIQPDRYSGTEIRRRIRAGEPWRELVPDCCADLVAEYADVIRASGHESLE